MDRREEVEESEECPVEEAEHPSEAVEAEHPSEAVEAEHPSEAVEAEHPSEAEEAQEFPVEEAQHPSEAEEAEHPSEEHRGHRVARRWEAVRQERWELERRKPSLRAVGSTRPRLRRGRLAVTSPEEVV